MKQHFHQAFLLTTADSVIAVNIETAMTVQNNSQILYWHSHLNTVLKERKKNWRKSLQFYLPPHNTFGIQAMLDPLVQSSFFLLLDFVCFYAERCSRSVTAFYCWIGSPNTIFHHFINKISFPRSIQINSIVTMEFFYVNGSSFCLLYFSRIKKKFICSQDIANTVRFVGFCFFESFLENLYFRSQSFLIQSNN